MDLGTILGLVVAIGSLLAGNTLEGGSVGSLISPSAALIVFGGTVGAAMISLSLRQTLRVPIVMRHALFTRRSDPAQAIKLLTDLARVARREGVLALEGEIANIDDKLIRRGIQLVVDGTDPEVTQDVLETEIESASERHTAAGKFFTVAGGLAPTLGVIGTVMGLVHMLSNLSDPGSMGPAIATAFLATLYGVSSANLFFLPIGNKLKLRSEEEQFVSSMIVTGIRGLQAGDSPLILGERLKAFVAPSERATNAEAEGATARQGGDAGEPVGAEA